MTIVSAFPRNSREESSPATVTFSKVRRENGPSDDQDYHITVRAFEEDITLKLQPTTSPFSRDLRVFQSGRDEAIREIHFDKRDLGSNLKFYTDKKRRASLAVEEDGPSLILEGILNKEYRITSKRNLQSRDSREEPATHTVYRRAQEHVADKRSCLGRSARSASTFVNSEVKSEGKRQDKVTYTAEIFLVLDYLTTQYFNADMQQITKYYGVFYNEVQHYYDNLVEPPVKLLVTSIYLTTDDDQETFLDPYPLSDRAEVNKCLDLFGTWLYVHDNELGNYDVAMLITGLDIGIYQWTFKFVFIPWPEWDSSINGIAYIATACYFDNEKKTSYKSGISEDIAGTYVGTGIHAHELGHVLGCTHDSVEPVIDTQPSSESCPWADGYVMSYDFGSKNKFYFSSCSVSQLKWYLQSNLSSCLLDQQALSTALPFNTPLPGQISSLDQQCKDVFGDNSCYYFNLPGNDVCSKLYCKSMFSPKEDTMGPAFEGSPCGVNMMCLRGVCANATV